MNAAPLSNAVLRAAAAALGRHGAVVLDGIFSPVAVQGLAAAIRALPERVWGRGTTGLAGGGQGPHRGDAVVWEAVLEAEVEAGSAAARRILDAISVLETVAARVARRTIALADNQTTAAPSQSSAHAASARMGARRSTRLLSRTEAFASRYPRAGRGYWAHIDAAPRESARPGSVSDVGAREGRVDDPRALTALLYLQDGPWDAKARGGSNRLELDGTFVVARSERRGDAAAGADVSGTAPTAAATSVRRAVVDVAPSGGRILLFDSRSIRHQVLPVDAASVSDRFALSLWLTEGLPETRDGQRCVACRAVRAAPGAFEPEYGHG
jgi:hypothetical protein